MQDFLSSRSPPPLIQLRRAKQDLPQPRLDFFRAKHLATRWGVSIVSVDGRVDEFGFRIRRVGELFLRVLDGLLHQRLGFQQLARGC